MALINFSGLASGIDSDSLIKATSDAARTQRVVPNQNKISDLQDTNSALSELKSKLSNLQSLTRKFSTINGGGVAKQGKSSDETVLTATASNTATNGTYTITPTQKAKNAIVSLKSTATYTSGDDIIAPTIAMGDPASPNRTMSIATGLTTDLETVDIVVSDTTTLNQFVTEYNNSATKSIASVVNVGTSTSADYRIVINSLNEGTQKGDINLTVGASLTTASAFNSNTTSQALDATFTISGITGVITRPTNTITDVIPGLSFTIEDTGSATVTVADDVNTTATRIQDFVDAYNEIVGYIAEQDLVSRQQEGQDVTNVFGPLADTSLDENFLSTFRTNVSSSVYSSGTKVRIFSDMGITTERDGTLKFDKSLLESAIGDESASVKRVLQTFGDTVSLTGGTIDSFIRFNGMIDTTVNSNQSLIDNLNDRIGQAEAQIAQQEATMRAQFARLESLVSRLQGQQQSLTSALSGLGR